jgi:putative ABC transport system permease protein
MKLAARNLLQDKTRLALSVAGVALAMMLILILTGFVSGINLQLSRYLDHAPGSVVLVQSGSQGNSSVLPSDTVDSVIHVPGVASAVPVISQYAVLDLGQSKQFAVVIGYDPAQGGGPWALREGRLPATDGEVVLDAVLADRHGVRLGDEFGLMGNTFKVVGLSAGTTTWMLGYVFMRLEAAQRLFGTPKAVSLVLVTPSSGVSPEELRSRLAGIAGTDVMLKSDLISTTRRTYLSVLGPILELIAAIAFVVGTLVVGIVVYTATLERQREYGVLKAVGARNRVLYRVVAAQALAAAVAGSTLGVGLALFAAQVIMVVRPQFLIAIDPTAAVLALMIGVGMALVAALFPARMLARLAPAEVFKR